MTKINGSMIRQLDNIFPGASLIVSSFNDEAPVDLMEKIAYTIKEANAFFGCHQFVATRVFTVNNFSQVLTIWHKAFGAAELLFVANTTGHKRGPFTLYIHLVELYIFRTI